MFGKGASIWGFFLYAKLGAWNSGRERIHNGRVSRVDGGGTAETQRDRRDKWQEAELDAGGIVLEPLRRSDNKAPECHNKIPLEPYVRVSLAVIPK
jgi:hypothetical protein